MKLYECPKGVMVKSVEDGTEFKFHHVDGMYSYCTMENGEVVHFAAWTEVELLGDEDGTDKAV